MTEVKWIKIVTDIFDDEKILLIENMPEADSIIVIWFKILCLAGKMNNSGVFLMNDKIAYTDEMLATIFRRNLNTVRLALKTFEKFGMVEIVDNVITIPNWSKHQTLDQLEEKKEYMREYMRTYRKKQKLIASGKVNSKINCKTNSKANVNRLEEDIDKDKELDIDKDIIKNIINFLNNKANTSYRCTTKKTKQLINTRIKEGFEEKDFYKVINKKVTEWKGTDMEKYLRPETLFGQKFESYLNQNITNKSNFNKTKGTFNNYEQRNYDFDNLEKKLLGWDKKEEE